MKMLLLNFSKKPPVIQNLLRLSSEQSRSLLRLTCKPAIVRTFCCQSVMQSVNQMPTRPSSTILCLAPKHLTSGGISFVFQRYKHVTHDFSEYNVSWDDLDWMNYDDENAIAYKELDITKLKPHPEFRNIAAGPVWGDRAFEKVWQNYFDRQTNEIIAKLQDESWKTYEDENEFDAQGYFSSADYKERYNAQFIWEDYRRNHKGGRPPQRTRLRCFIGEKCVTGSPCPICRDDKILINYRNIALLKQFINPESGAILKSLRTGVCRRQQKELEEAIMLARDFGFLFCPVDVPSQNVESYKVDHLAVKPWSS